MKVRSSADGEASSGGETRSKIAIGVVVFAITFTITKGFDWITAPTGPVFGYSWEQGPFNLPPIDDRLRPPQVGLGPVHETDVAIQRLSALDAYLFPMEKYRSYATLVFTNIGDQIAKNVYIKLPSEGLALLETENGQTEVLSDVDTINVGEVKVGVSISLKFWSRERWDSSEYPLIGHEVGRPQILYERNSAPSSTWIAITTSIVALIVSMLVLSQASLVMRRLMVKASSLEARVNRAKIGP